MRHFSTWSVWQKNRITSYNVCYTKLLRILVGATEAQKEKWLGKIAEGNTIVAYGVTEPNAGSNLAALKTKADPVTDENGNVTGYILNGNKQFIS